MSNKTRLLELLRIELGDTGAESVWSENLLDALLDEAVAWYGRLWPRQSAAYRDVAEAQRTFTMPPETYGVTQVECPPGTALPQEAGGTNGAARPGSRQAWSAWGSTVYLLNPASGDEVGAGRLVMRVLMPWDRLDPVDDWNGPEEDERLLLLRAASEAWAWLGGQHEKRGRAGGVGAMARRYAEKLESEVQSRRRAATSKRLEKG